MDIKMFVQFSMFDANYDTLGSIRFADSILGFQLTNYIADHTIIIRLVCLLSVKS